MAGDKIIHYKVAIVADGVMIAHECGIVQTSIKDLLSIKPIKEGQLRTDALHPDLVEAAMTSIETMARKYNGVEYGQDKTTNEGQQKANADAGQEVGGNADEKAGQVAEEKVA